MFPRDGSIRTHARPFPRESQESNEFTVKETFPSNLPTDRFHRLSLPTISSLERNTEQSSSDFRLRGEKQQVARRDKAKRASMCLLSKIAREISVSPSPETDDSSTEGKLPK